MSDYVTVKKAASDEFTEKRSRFIGHIMPVKSREEAEEFIASIKSKYWDARHNVYAYVLRDGNIQKYSDDGEPQGTAGVPVLEVLLKEGVTDCVVVVTRYFGGILLGTGGLTRAYSKSAKIAIEAGGRKNMLYCDELLIKCDYAFYGVLGSLLPAFDAVTVSEEFTDLITLRVAVRKADTARFIAEVIDRSGGRVTPEPVGEGYFEGK